MAIQHSPGGGPRGHSVSPLPTIPLTNFLSLPLEIRQMIYNLIFRRTTLYVKSEDLKNHTICIQSDHADQALLDARYSNATIAFEAKEQYLKTRYGVHTGTLALERANRNAGKPNKIKRIHFQYSAANFCQWLTHLFWSFTIGQLHSRDAHTTLTTIPRFPHLKQIGVTILQDENARQARFFTATRQDKKKCEELTRLRSAIIDRVGSEHDLYVSFDFACPDGSKSHIKLDAEVALAMWTSRERESRPWINMGMSEGCLLRLVMGDLQILYMGVEGARDMGTCMNKVWWRARGR